MSTALNPSEAGVWARWAADFDRVAVLFQSNFANLQRLSTFVRTQSPAIQQKYDDLVRRGAAHQAELANLKRTRDQVGSWLNSMGQAVVSTIGAGVDWLRSRFGLGGLGIVPVVVGVAGAAAAALVLYNVAKWINDSLAFQNQMNQIYRLIESGSSPQQAAQIVSQASEQSQSSGLIPSLVGKIPWTMIILGGAIIFLGPHLMRMFEKRGA